MEPKSTKYFYQQDQDQLIKKRDLGLIINDIVDVFSATNSLQIRDAGKTLTKVNDTNVTLVLGGTPATALLETVSLTLGWTGTLSTARGGTATGVVAAGDMLYGGPALTWAKRAIGTAGDVLTVSGGLPTWSTPIVQISRTTAQFDKTTNTTLANITGLTITIVSGKKYKFRAVLDVSADAVGGSKFAIAGTATATSIYYWIILTDGGTNANTIVSHQTALAGSAGQAGTTTGKCVVEGAIVCNAGGTITAQFAQQASSGTSSILINSTFEAIETS